MAKKPRPPIEPKDADAEEAVGQVAAQAPDFHGAPPLSTTRPLTTFTVPASARRKNTDPLTLGFEELTAGQIIDAYTAGAGNQQRIGAELAQRSIRAVDGRRVNDEDMMVLWEQWSSKVRMLAMMGYKSIHNSSDEEDEAFLSSAAVK